MSNINVILFEDEEVDLYVHRLGKTASQEYDFANNMEKYYMTGDYQYLTMDATDAYMEMLNYLGPHAMKLSLFPDLLDQKKNEFTKGGFLEEENKVGLQRSEESLRLIVDASLTTGRYPAEFKFQMGEKDNGERIMDYLLDHPDYTMVSYVQDINTTEEKIIERAKDIVTVEITNDKDFCNVRNEVYYHVATNQKFRYYRMGDRGDLNRQIEDLYMALDVMALLRVTCQTTVILTPGAIRCRPYLDSSKYKIYEYDPYSYAHRGQILWTGFDKQSYAHYRCFWYEDVLNMKELEDYLPSMMYHRGVVVATNTRFSFVSNEVLKRRAYKLLACCHKSAFFPFFEEEDVLKNYFADLSILVAKSRIEDKSKRVVSAREVMTMRFLSDSSELKKQDDLLIAQFQERRETRRIKILRPRYQWRDIVKKEDKENKTNMDINE